MFNLDISFINLDYIRTFDDCTWILVRVVLETFRWLWPELDQFKIQILSNLLNETNILFENREIVPFNLLIVNQISVTISY